MHSGNIGHAQNLDSLIRAATFLRDLDDLRIVLIGGGARRQELKDLARLLEVEQVRFFGYQPREVLPESLSCADIHVVGLAKGLSGYVVPSRLYGILAVGRPVIVAADAESETAQVVREAEAGVVVPPDRPDLLAAAIRRARDGELDLEAMGRSGREYVSGGRPRRRDRALPRAPARPRRGERAVVSRRVAVIVGVVALVAVLLVAIGRWERGHRADEEVAGMERVLAAIGPLDNPTLASFRFLTELPVPRLPAGQEPGRARGCASTPTAASSRRSTAGKAKRRSGACARTRPRRRSASTAPRSTACSCGWACRSG